MVVCCRGALGLCRPRDADLGAVFVDGHLTMVCAVIAPLRPNGDDRTDVARELEQPDDNHEELKPPKEHPRYLRPEYRRWRMVARYADRETNRTQC